MIGRLPDGFRQVLASEEIKVKVGDLANRISRDHEGETPLLVGVLKGAFIFMADLVRAISIPVEIDFAQISSYGDETDSTGRIKVLKDINTPIAGRHVVIVEDIIDTGLTLKHYLDELSRRKPRSLRLCALINKTERQEYKPHIDYLGFTVSKGFLVGYGLDCAGRWRELSGVYEVLEPGKILLDV